MTTLRSLLAILLLGSLLALGCGDEDSGPTGNDNAGHPPASMVDSWVFQSVMVDSAPASLADVLDWVAGAVQAKIHIQANGAYTYEEVNVSGGQLWYETGYAIVEGESLELNATEDSDGPTDETSLFTYTLVADTLTVSTDDAGSVVDFRLQRLP